jgi:hypothetical protein
LEKVETSEDSIRINYKIVNNTNEIIWLHKKAGFLLCLIKDDTIFMAPVYAPSAYMYGFSSKQYDGFGYNEYVFDVETIKINPDDTITVYFNYCNDTPPLSSVFTLNEDYTLPEFIDLTLIFTYVDIEYPIKYSTYTKFVLNNAVFIKSIFNITTRNAKGSLR